MEVMRKNWHLFFMERFVFMPMPAQTLFWFERDLTVRQAANHL